MTLLTQLEDPKQEADGEIDYRRFKEKWIECHNADKDFRGMPFTQNHVELPSPAIQAASAFELDATEASFGGLPTVLERSS